MPPNSIALIGFMCTGKTTVGKKLADILGEDYKFIETDKIIENLANKSIPQIFSEDGEIKFREYEMEACKKVSNYNKAVISCGGGIVLNKLNIDYLKQNSYIVLLQAAPDIVYERAVKDGKKNRPVIDKKNMRQEIKKVLDFRKPFYERSADVIIDTSNKSIDEVVSEIIRNLKIKN